MPESIAGILPFALAALGAFTILVAGWVASRWLYRVARRMLDGRHVDPAAAGFLANLVRYLVLAAAVIASLQSLGIETTSFVALLASGGIAIGLALQGSLASFASGVLILVLRPFTVGHVITAGGQTGEVREIGLFGTTLVTPDNLEIIVPNSAITGGVILNHTSRGIRRGEVAVTVAIDGDVNAVSEKVLEAARMSPLVLTEPAPAVAVVGFVPGAVQMKVLVWAPFAQHPDMLDQVHRAVHGLLNRERLGPPVLRHLVESANGMPNGAEHGVLGT